MARNASAPAAKAKQTPGSIDEYLSGVTNDKRAALQKLRNDIRAAVPSAQECISYGIPGFRLNGKYLLGFGATRNHCAFYIGSTAQRAKDQLRNYNFGKGTIRFQPEKPLPTTLVRKLVQARIAERAAR